MATIDTRYYDDTDEIRITAGATLNSDNGTILITDADGNNVDLTGYTSLKLLVKYDLEDADSAAILSFDSTSGQIVGADGSFVLVRDAADTDVVQGNHRFAMKGVNSGAEIPISRGDFIVDPKGVE